MLNELNALQTGKSPIFHWKITICHVKMTNCSLENHPILIGKPIHTGGAKIVHGHSRMTGFRIAVRKGLLCRGYGYAQMPVFHIHIYIYIYVHMYIYKYIYIYIT